MGFQIIFIIAMILVGLWILGGAFSLASTQKARKEKAALIPRPELRMAEQWLRSSQADLENLMERMDAPLGSAQHELLELRLEAGRVPEGVKSINTVREQLAGGLKDSNQPCHLRERVEFYLKQGEFLALSDEWMVLKTPQGEIPCFQAFSAGDRLSEDSIRTSCQTISSKISSEKNEFYLVFFPEESQMKRCLASPEWSRAFQDQQTIPLDLKGLTALLISLRLHFDVINIMGTFEEGVRSTQALVGQADRMSAIMGKLNADTVRARILLDGGSSSPLAEESKDSRLEPNH